MPLMLLQRFLPLLQVAWLDQTVREYVFLLLFFFFEERERELVIFGFQFAHCMRALLRGLFCKMVGRRKAHKYTACSSSMLATFLQAQLWLATPLHFILLRFSPAVDRHCCRSLLFGWPLFTCYTVRLLVAILAKITSTMYPVCTMYPEPQQLRLTVQTFARRCHAIIRPKSFAILYTFHTKISM